MKYLIVGLGNIGSEYVNTRHNIGFKIVDALAKASTIFFETNKLGDTVTLNLKGRTFILLKPSTFMNLSGKAVNYWLQNTKIDAANMLVITDDISLPFGVLRMRKKGSDGGHNGLKNIQAVLGNSNYPRLRFGVGDDFSRGKQVEYVLDDFSDEDYTTMNNRMEMAVKMIQAFATIGIDYTMSDFNGK